jgi:small basic protein (TIGR04137 family)
VGAGFAVWHFRGPNFSLFTRQNSRIVRALHFKRNHFFMSQHRSLKGQSTIAAKRNVLKRFERVEVLKSRGLFKDGDKVIGLRKTKPNA